MYTVTIRQAPALQLVALPHRGPYAEIGGKFVRLAAWAGPRGLIGPDSRMVGVYLDDPDTVAAADLRSYAGVTVAELPPLDDGMERLDYPAGPVACMVHKGPYADLPQAYRHLYGTWLPGSGHAPADRPGFEVYLNDPRETPAAALLTEINLPLAA